jgi:hypothetical protein
MSLVMSCIWKIEADLAAQKSDWGQPLPPRVGAPAVFKLITSSNFVGRSIGMSAGLARL